MAVQRAECRRRALAERMRVDGLVLDPDCRDARVLTKVEAGDGQHVAGSEPLGATGARGSDLPCSPSSMTARYRWQSDHQPESPKLPCTL
jgi:hypothetical protein